MIENELWEKSGLLDGLSNEDKIALAKILEETRLYVTNEEVCANSLHKRTSGLIFIVLRRLFERKIYFDHIKIVKELSDSLFSDYELYDGKNYYSITDECDFVSDFLIKYTNV